MASGLTPIYLLPYPLSTDPVNVHGDIEDLADRLETLFPLFVRVDQSNTFVQPNVFNVNSTSTAVRITQTGTGNALLVEDSANPDATPFVITSSGNVGIRTLSPTTTFNVIGQSLFEADAAATIPIVVRGAVSQSGNLQEWQNSASAILARVSSTGAIFSVTAAVDTNDTQVATTAFVLGQASSSNPLALGTVAIGTSTRYARADHVHPTTGLGLTSGTLGQFAATTSSALAGVISDETGTGALVFGTGPTLSQPVINNPRLGYTTTATAAGTTTLTSTSSMQQFFTGSTTQTVVLPVTSTLALGQAYIIHNNSTGNVTVQSSGANNIYVIPSGMTVQFTCILTSGTTAASWDFDITGNGSVTGTGAIVLADGPTINNLNLTGQVTGLELSFGQSIVFEGTTADANELTLTAGEPTQDRTITLPDATGTVALTNNKLSVFASTTSSELAGVISDETGTGVLVFATSPTLTGLVTINTPNASTGGLLVKGFASQSANLQEWQNSGNTVVASISPTGVIGSATWQGNAIGAIYGGTGQTSYTAGDILYSSATNTLAKLGIGTSGQVLTVSGGVPAWAPAPVSLPSQTGNGGKYLTTDGTTASWATIQASAAFAQDTEPVSPVEGTIWLDTDGIIVAPTDDIIPLDDLSNYFDGGETRFAPTYQGDLQGILNPLSLMVSINGIIQYVNFPEYVWMSGIPQRGFFVDYEGYLQFSEAVPAGSEFDGRIMPGNTGTTRTKVYPFRPLDILLGG
jgi:hypothetical protein